MDDKDFWKDIVYKDGKLDEEQVMKELEDYRFIMQEVSKVYYHVTGGKLSKIMYKAEVIIAEADDLSNRTFDENMKEYVDDACAKKDATIAEQEATIAWWKSEFVKYAQDAKEKLATIAELKKENAELMGLVKEIAPTIQAIVEYNRFKGFKVDWLSRASKYTKEKE